MKTVPTFNIFRNYCCTEYLHQIRNSLKYKNLLPAEKLKFVKSCWVREIRNCIVLLSALLVCTYNCENHRISVKSF